MKSEKLQGKDLINVGIYSAIYFVVVFAIAMLGYIPIFMVLISALVPILAGIPFMLFLTKVKKFGMIWIMSLLMGLLMLLTGMGYYSLIVGAVTGLLAELIYKSGNYRSTGKAILTAGVFSIWVWGNYLPFFLDIEKYFSTRQEYIDAMTRLMPAWMCPALFAAAFIGGIIGGVIGKSLLKKHFTRAGIA